MKKAISILCLAILSLYGFKLEDLKDIKRDNIKGEFIQSKRVVGFSNEIKSSGEFSIKDNILLWQTKKPIENTIKITKDGIFTLRDSKWIETSQNYDKSLFLSVVNLDFEALENNFEIEISGSKDAWNLSLKPKGVILAKIFDYINISGGEYVKSIVLKEQSGDLTTNSFSNVKFNEKS